MTDHVTDHMIDFVAYIKHYFEIEKVSGSKSLVNAIIGLLDVTTGLIS